MICIAAVIAATWVVATSNAQPIPGVHVPLNITPSVNVNDGQWLVYIYLALFDRQPDDAGFRVNFGDLQRGMSREAMYTATIKSAEFQSKPQLWKRDGFIARAYVAIFHRTAQPSEISSWAARLTSYNGTSGGSYGIVPWYQFIQDMLDSQEFFDRCPKQYYTLGAPVTYGSPLLRDIFNRTHRLQSASESTVLTLNMPTATAVWDQKLITLPNPEAATDGIPYIAFSRAYLGSMFTIVALATDANATVFTEISPVFVGVRSSGKSFYDPHVSVDYSVCPPRYVMAMECLGHGGAASLCTSFSSTPSRPYSWTDPFIVVDGCVSDRPSTCATQAAESASTGVTLHDGYAKYLAWTQVYDGIGPHDPLAHTYSQMAGPVDSAVDAYYGTVMGGVTPVLTMMASVPQPWCTSSWDCNNRDKQDWKREGDMYYVAYNGANYYRCNGRWGINFVRSATPVDTPYTDYAPISEGIMAVLNNTCGISYPTINVINGEIRIHYAYRDANGAAATLSAKIVPLH